MKGLPPHLSWTHPVHAKGIRGTDYSALAHVRGPLTDKVINRLVREGVLHLKVKPKRTKKAKALSAAQKLVNKLISP